MNPYSVIVRPILSEKSTEVRDVSNKYVFEVRRNANKEDVAKAVKLIWDVKVQKVNTLVRRGKVKYRGNRASKPSNFKLAYITLEKDQKLPIFEDQ